MIELERLHKRFGSTVAVSDVSLLARNGHVTGLLGPNGAGKTTTLRMLTGLLSPARGTVTIDGVDVHQNPYAARARLGVLPENIGLYDRLTVREHLVYTGTLHGYRGTELARRVDSIIERVALARVAGRRAAGLSLGERRRVALARALVHEPANVVLDEPTNGLDVLGVRDVRTEIRRLSASGCAVVLSTHVMPEISAVCDRIVVLANGRVVAEGAPHDIQARAAAPTLEEAFVRVIGSAEGLNG